MQEISIVLLFLCIFHNGFSQKYDLITTDKGESIACRIDSITDAAVYLKMKYNDRWVHTNVMRDEVTEFQHDSVYKNLVLFRPGTSIIEMAYDEHDAEHVRAFKLRKAGRSLNIAGTVIIGTGVLSAVAIGVGIEGSDMLVGSIVILSGIAGISALSVGIPMNLTGIKRIEQILSSRNTAMKKDRIIDLKPCAQYNLMTNNYLPGIMLRIRF